MRIPHDVSSVWQVRYWPSLKPWITHTMHSSTVSSNRKSLTLLWLLWIVIVTQSTGVRGFDEQMPICPTHTLYDVYSMGHTKKEGKCKWPLSSGRFSNDTYWDSPWSLTVMYVLARPSFGCQGQRAECLHRHRHSLLQNHNFRFATLGFSDTLLVTHLPTPWRDVAKMLCKGKSMKVPWRS